MDLSNGGEHMAKMGRPKKDVTKSNSIGVRLSDQHYISLVRYASEHELTITQVVQKALEEFLKSK